MSFEDFWEDLAFRFGPFAFGWSGLGENVRYRRTDDSHIIRIRINPEIKKEEIKARLIKPGVLEVEWPRRVKGEDIPVE